MSDVLIDDTWEFGVGPSEAELDDCRYEEQRCVAEILVDEAAAAHGITLLAEERDDAVAELLDGGLEVRFEEDRLGDSFTRIVEHTVAPLHAIWSAQRWRESVRLRVVPIVWRARCRPGRRAQRKHRRSVRRPARAPARLDDPHERPGSSGRRLALQAGGCL